MVWPNRPQRLGPIFFGCYSFTYQAGRILTGDIHNCYVVVSSRWMATNGSKNSRCLAQIHTWNCRGGPIFLVPLISVVHSYDFSAKPLQESTHFLPSPPQFQKKYPSNYPILQPNILHTSWDSKILKLPHDILPSSQATMTSSLSRSNAASGSPGSSAKPSSTPRRREPEKPWLFTSLGGRPGLELGKKMEKWDSPVISPWQMGNSPTKMRRCLAFSSWAFHHQWRIFRQATLAGGSHP